MLMYEPQNEVYYQQPVITQERIASYLAKVMGWMCVGLLTTVVSAVAFSTIDYLQYLILSGSLFYVVLVAQLLVVIAMSAAINKISAGTATVLFMVYSAMMGITMSIFFWAYELSSIIIVFGLTSGIFLLMSVYGAVTKKDLTRMGSLLLFGLLGIILGGIINMFMGNTMLDFALTCIGIVLFIGLTAYDTQRIKYFYIHAVDTGHAEESPVVQKMAIFGALTLYLDFINLFLKLLRLLGKRK